MELYTYDTRLDLFSLLGLAMTIALIIALYWLIKYLRAATTVQDLKAQKLKDELMSNRTGQSNQSSSSSI